MDSEKRKKDREAADWLSKPIYRILIIGLVLLELLGKEMDGGQRNFIHIVLWIGLSIVVLIGVADFVMRFTGKGKGAGEKGKVGGGEENESA